MQVKRQSISLTPFGVQSEKFIHVYCICMHGCENSSCFDLPKWYEVTEVILFIEILKHLLSISTDK